MNVVMKLVFTVLVLVVVLEIIQYSKASSLNRELIENGELHHHYYYNAPLRKIEEQHYETGQPSFSDYFHRFTDTMENAWTSVKGERIQMRALLLIRVVDRLGWTSSGTFQK